MVLENTGERGEIRKKEGKERNVMEDGGKVGKERGT
jgi:hypothetical protein